MSARDVIATKLPFAEGIRNAWAGDIIDALEAAGYRILAPGELDSETLEVAARIAERAKEGTDEAPTDRFDNGHGGRLIIAVSDGIADAIRNLRSAG